MKLRKLIKEISSFDDVSVAQDKVMATLEILQDKKFKDFMNRMSLVANHLHDLHDENPDIFDNRGLAVSVEDMVKAYKDILKKVGNASGKLSEAEGSLSAGLSKTVNKLKDLYLKKQTLVKAFKNSDTSAEKKDDIKKALIALAKQIKSQEDIFGGKIKDEPIDGDDE
jgi:hypothetical protein